MSALFFARYFFVVPVLLLAGIMLWRTLSKE